MKLTKTALLKKTPDLFDTPDNVYREFQDYCEREKSELPSNLVLLYADYTYENYSGDAYVLGYNKDNKQFFEVHGSHCSYYGLEDQWEPEETSVELLTHRLQKGTLGDFYKQNYEKEIRDALINI